MKNTKRIEAVAAANVLYPRFIGRAQMIAILEGCKGEEGDYFADLLIEYAARVAAMPATYGTDGQRGQAVAHLRYFAGGQATWWITEKDVDTDGEGQIQAFGLADLFGDGGELGYISIAEIIANGGEMDLHYRPRTLEAINPNLFRKDEEETTPETVTA
jgi:hypothetical protein